MKTGSGDARTAQDGRSPGSTKEGSDLRFKGRRAGKLVFEWELELRPARREPFGILLYRRGDELIADPKDLPGSPPVGHGSTGAEAVMDLFAKLLSGRRLGPEILARIETYGIRLEDIRGIPSTKEAP